MNKKPTKINEGDYIGIVGDYSGMVFFNGKWHRYQCGGCMRANGLLKVRLSAGDHPRLAAKFSSMPIEFRHDVKLHGEWLRNGKK